MVKVMEGVPLRFEKGLIHSYTLYDDLDRQAPWFTKHGTHNTRMGSPVAVSLAIDFPCLDSHTFPVLPSF